MALREQVDSVPPDLPGFDDVRVRFYATEEGRGTTDAKKMWLAGQLEAAVKSGNPAELEQVSKDITATYDDIRKIDELHVKLLHQVMSFQRMARRNEAAEKEAEKQAAEAAAAAPRSKSARAKNQPSKSP
jgi:CO dehydrogenase/acetyl-CoA synthase beta subunit